MLRFPSLKLGSFSSSRILWLIKVLILLLWITLASAQAPLPIYAEDAMGRRAVINPVGYVSVVTAGSPELGDTTRRFNGALDEFKGRSDFRTRVVVDLRGSLGAVFKDITRGRIQKEMREEATRLKPYYLQNQNPHGNPVDDIAIIADFDGSLCEQLGWGIVGSKVKVSVFDKSGIPIKIWLDLQDPQELKQFVAQMLNRS